jgi:hypothetical protein
MPDGDDKAARFYALLSVKTATCFVMSHWPYTPGIRARVSEPLKLVWCGGKAAIDAYKQIYGDDPPHRH